MTDLTDEEAKALLAECDNPDCLTCEYARALLDARAELTRLRADAAAAVALVVSELRQFVTDSYQCGCMDAGCAGRHAERNSTLEALSETLDALAPADGLAAVDALRADVERLNRWRAEEGEKIKRQAKALTDLTKHCQRIEAENAGLARKIGKVQRGDGDHSQIADLEAKVINQRNELANLRARDGRLAELAADRYRLAAANAALEAKVAGLVEALKPFCFFSDEPNTTQEAWEIRYCDRFKDWIDFADIESARAALAPVKEGE